MLSDGRYDHHWGEYGSGDGNSKHRVLSMASAWTFVELCDDGKAIEHKGDLLFCFDEVEQNLRAHLSGMKVM